MERKVVLITGATSGIGRAGAEALAQKGWKVLVHARSNERGTPVLEALRKAVPGGEFDLVTGELSSLQGVVALADQVAEKAPVLDALWNNAGGLQSRRLESSDGVELQRAVNHLAPFVLTHRLLPRLKAAPAGRVVFTASMAHAFGPSRVSSWLEDKKTSYSPMGTHALTKLANILVTQELQRRLVGTSVTAHCFHPGWVNTGFGSGGAPRKPSFVGWVTDRLALRPDQGADTGVFLVDDPAPPATPGLYWDRRRVKKPSKTSAEAALRLWDETERVVQRIQG